MHLAYLHYQHATDTAMHHVRQFSEAARALGHHVDVRAMNFASPQSRGDTASKPRARVRSFLKQHFSRYLHEPKELLWNLRYLHHETRLLRADPPDVLLVRDHYLTYSCMGVSRRLNLPLVLEVNSPPDESWLYLDQYSHVPWIPEHLERIKLRSAHKIVVVSTALKQHLVSRFGVAESTISVVPNGADTERFHPGVAGEPQTKAALHDGPVIGFVGSFQKWHGTDLLMRMAAAVASVRPGVRFLFVGDGPDAPMVRRAVADFADRLVLTGHVEHARVPPLVACMDVTVMPESNFYGSPLKVLEWMAAGRAVVAPAYGPVAEVIDDGVHGLLFPPGDDQALVRAVLRLIDDGGLRAKLGTAASEHVRTALTWRHNAERVLQACRVAGESHARAEGRARFVRVNSS